MQWSNLSDSENGLGTVLIIFTLEIIFLTAFSLVIDSDTVRNHCYQWYEKISSQVKGGLVQNKDNSSPLLPVDSAPYPDDYPIHEPEDVHNERERTLKPAPVTSDPLNPMAASQQGPVIRVLGLRAVYPGQDGNPDKVILRRKTRVVFAVIVTVIV